MNKLEELQSEIITGTQFIKSYPMLNLINITSSEKSFIELVLSYQLNGQKFYMEFSDIAEILGIKKQSVSNLVKSLKSLEFISTSNTSSFHNKTREFNGSTTFITVNEDKIIASVQSSLSNKPNLEAEILKEVKKKAFKSIKAKVEVVVPEPIKEVVRIKELTIEDELEDTVLSLVIEPVINDKKEKLRLEYNEMFKNQDSKMLPLQFNTLTHNIFYGINEISISDRMLPKNDFE